MRASLLAIAVVIAAVACKIPSTLGLPCDEDAHCDTGQFCSADGTCQQGSAGTTSSPATDGSGTDTTTTTSTSESSTTEPMTSTSSTGPACGQAIGVCDALDVLVVVDNSGSMNDEISELLPQFVDLDVLFGPLIEGVCSYHIGVTTTEVAPDYQPAQCQLRGALSQSGAILGGESCWGDPDHPPYVTEDDALSTLGCALAVGMNYDTDEKQLDTVLAALDPGINASGACNDGFLRDDTPLLIVLVTDEDDDDDVGKPNEANDRTGSIGGPQQWFDALTAIRPAESMAMVVVTADDPQGCNWSPLPGLSDGTGAEYAERILLFLQRFNGVGHADHVTVSNICGTGDEIMAELLNALDVVLALCEDAQ